MSCVWIYNGSEKWEDENKEHWQCQRKNCIDFNWVCECFCYHDFSFRIEYFTSATQWNLIHYSFTFYYESRIRILDYLCEIFKICDISNVQTFHFGHVTDSLDPNNGNVKYAQQFFWAFDINEKGWKNILFWSIFIIFIHSTDCHLIE